MLTHALRADDAAQARKSCPAQDSTASASQEPASTPCPTSCHNAATESSTKRPRPTKAATPPCQKTLGFFGVQRTKVDASGKKWTAPIPADVPIVTKPRLDCPWCDSTFATTSALGSHKKFAHTAAYNASLLNGTKPGSVGEGDIPLDVVNWTMLLIGKLEHEVGELAGAYRLDQHGRKIMLARMQEKRRGAATRVRTPLV